MPSPKIETFEYNIVDEINNKESDWVDISKLDENKDVKKDVTKKISSNEIILSTLFILLIIALGILFTLKLTSPKQAPPLTEENLNSSSAQITLSSILPTTNYNVGNFISSVSLINNGYAIKLKEFSPVYAYILKNESSFGNELQKVFNIEQSPTMLTFKDLTISNQDMRILNNGTSTIVYAFIEDKTLVLSTSTENILTIKSVILSR